MWILALGPIIAGLALALIAVLILVAEVVGKGAVAAAQLTWDAVNPANHRRPVRQAG